MLLTKRHHRRIRLISSTLAFFAIIVATGASAASNDNDDAMVQNRSVFGEIGHYIVNNSYGSLGVLRFEYIGDSNNLHASGTAAALAGGSSVANSGSSISNETTMGATLGLFIPKTAHHLSIEFGLAPPIDFDFQVSGSGQNIGGSGNPLAAAVLGGPIGKKVGTFKALPPNFTLVFRPFTHTVIQPYIGAGAMWLHTYDQNVSNPRFAQAAQTLGATKARLDLSQPWACVAQAGFDVELPKPLFFKFDARYVGCATVDAKLELGTIKSGPGAGTDLGTVTSKNDFEAMLYQASFGINF